MIVKSDCNIGKLLLSIPNSPYPDQAFRHPCVEGEVCTNDKGHLHSKSKAVVTSLKWSSFY